MRATLRAVVSILVTAAALIAPVLSPGPAARAADLGAFDPGNIISDVVFFDSLSMNVGDVQAFLDAMGSSCLPGADGTACLKDYRLTTSNRTADAWCSGYTGTTETAASVIARVAASCGVSPRVLLVLLQKEQGLVTGTKPTASRYTKATGYACPDTGSGCDPAFAGLMNQLYNAARQYQRYADGVAGSYRAGRTQSIQYHPNAACGTQSVYIANVATAGLYNYTPYVPNAAALAAGYGTGDACSAYGNRNFFSYFTDWFGSTQSVGGSAILAKYEATGGRSGPLGATTSRLSCALIGGGCFQHFAGGSVYWSPSSGAAVVSGPPRTRWSSLGWERSSLGYPVSDTWCGLTGGGCFQQFQGGSLYSVDGTAPAWIVRGAVRDRWAATGWESGWLGYPTSDENCGLAGGACFNVFQHGAVYWVPKTGAHPVSAAMMATWGRLGFESGPLGYPIAGTECGLVQSGCRQDFQGGSLYESSTTAGRLVRGGVREAWLAVGGEQGTLGYPTSDENCGLLRGGCFETFTGGSVYWSPETGAHVVSGAVGTRWAEFGWEAGQLGYPVNDTFCGLAASGCGQHFQSGSLYWSADTGARLVRGGIRSAWAATGWETGPLGYPTSDENCGLPGGGCFETFTGGSVYWTPQRGGLAVLGPVLAAWASRGYESGSLGYPVEAARTTTGGITQRFERGTLTYRTATGTVTVS